MYEDILALILERAKTTTQTPALVAPLECGVVESANRLLTACDMTPEFQAKELHNPFPNTPIGSEFIEELTEACKYLLSKGTDTERNNATWLRSVELRKANYEYADALELVREWNKLNNPLLSDHEIVSTVQSAYSGSGYDPGTRAFPELLEARNHARTQLGKSPLKQDDDVVEIPGESPANKLKLKLLPFCQLIVSSDFNRVQAELIGRWLSYAGKVICIGGREKSGKSTFVWYDMLYALKKSKRVLWVSGLGDNDDDEIHALCEDSGYFDLPVEQQMCLFVAADDRIPTSWEELGDLIEEIEPEILVLDTIASILNAVHPGGVPDTSAGEEWQRVVSHIKPAALEHKMAVVWIHHVSKGNPNELRGSTGIGAAVDCISIMTYKSKWDYGRTIRSQGRRSVRVKREIFITYVGGIEGFTELEEGEASTALDQKAPVSEALCNALIEILKDGVELSKQEVLTMLDERNVEYSVSTLVRVRKKIGIIVKRAGPISTWYLPMDHQSAEDFIQGEENNDL